MALLRNGSVTARNIACITFATRYVLREPSSRGTGIHVTQDKPEYHGRGRCGADLARSAAQPDRHGRPHAKPGCALPRHGSAVRRRTAERSRVARERLLCAYRASSAGCIGAADSGGPGCRRGGRRVGAAGTEPGSATAGCCGCASPAGGRWRSFGAACGWARGTVAGSRGCAAPACGRPFRRAGWRWTSGFFCARPSGSLAQRDFDPERSGVRRHRLVGGTAPTG